VRSTESEATRNVAGSTSVINGEKKLPYHKDGENKNIPLLVGGFNPSETYESQLEGLFPIYGKIKNDPNHQPALIMIDGFSIKLQLLFNGFSTPSQKCH